MQHVYKAAVVTGLPMYGYHPRQHSFVKIYLYNPHLVRRAAELLQVRASWSSKLELTRAGAGGRGDGHGAAAPREPHQLRAAVDDGLQSAGHEPGKLHYASQRHIFGHSTFCFQIHLSHALFRQGSVRDEYDDMEPVVEVPWRKARTRGRRPSLDSSLPSQTQDAGTVLASYLSIPPGERLFCVEDMAECLKLPAEVLYRSINFESCGQFPPAPACRCPASPPRSWSWTPWPRTSSTTRT